METLTINIPDKKSALVKQILRGVGVIIQDKKVADNLSYQDKITKISVWEDEDIKSFDEAKNSFNFIN